MFFLSLSLYVIHNAQLLVQSNKAKVHERALALTCTINRIYERINQQTNTRIEQNKTQGMKTKTSSMHRQQNIRYIEWTTTTTTTTKKLLFCVCEHDTIVAMRVLYIAYVRLNHVKMAISVTFVEFSPVFFLSNFSLFISHSLSRSVCVCLLFCVLAFFSLFVFSFFVCEVYFLLLTSGSVYIVTF